MTKIPPKQPTIQQQGPAQQAEGPAQQQQIQSEGPQQQRPAQQTADQIDRGQHPKLMPDPPAGPTIQQADPGLPQVKPGIGQVPVRDDASQQPSVIPYPGGPIIEMRPPDDGGSGQVPGPIVEMRPPDDGGSGQVPGPIIEMRPPDGPIVEMRPPDGDSQLQAHLLLRVESLARGHALPEAPDVSNLQHVFLRDSRPVDGDRVDAYVDQSAGTFYLKSTGAGMGGPDTIGPYWYGPFELYLQDGPIVEMRPPDDGGTIPYPGGPIVEMRPPDDGGSIPYPGGPIVEMRPPDGPIVEMRPPDGPIVEMRPPDGDSQLQAHLMLRLQNLARGHGVPTPDVSNLQHVFLYDSRPVDGDRADAYVDQSAGTFYLKSTGAGMGGPDTIGPYWYGPFELYPQDGPIVEMRPPDSDDD